MVSRNTIVSYIEKIYNKEKNKLKDILGRIPNRICLTSDVWTASTSEGYICLTAHFVDERWRLTSCVLNFCRMKPPHNGIALEATLFDCLKQWGIDKKVFSITLDNASSNDNMQDHLKKHLCVQSNLLCDGEYFHVRCSVHILNLIVQEGLKVANEALKKIRESVKYIKGSDGRMIKFKDCVNDAGISLTGGLRLDVSTRWNSTYLMLESALKYRKAFEFFQVADMNYKHCPSDEDWERGESILWKVQCILEENQDQVDDVIREMATDMKTKFDKYGKEYSVVLAFVVILDPRLKVPFLKYCYTTLDALTCNVKLKNVEDKFRVLYQEYVNIFNHQSVVLSQSSQDSNSLSKSSREGSKTKKCKIISGFKNFQNQPISDTGKSELDAYLEEKSIEVDEEHYEDFEVLLYWKINEKKYHVLSLMARDVLSIPITTIASESSFSIGGRVLTKYRSSTLPDHI
ncbi:zinc finger BED domain-containing protein RICESLEEPER 2-like [Cicer arietinum]|uniref:Zinc finger BED domain-containing protein RICESLEEPER 2-like n=1 Tax=Cicer arietinum TaxID=3827 RepID=A0A3Q7YDY6_CICAR|nr:zinc finger BED domain-containing protein RICESLEEPER 2-like [Cicer arietinum]